MNMTIEEAREFLIFISRTLGNMSIEYLTEKDGEKMREAIKALEQEPKTIQEKQAESEKYQIAYDNGYDNGYAQARFDYEQEPETGHWIPISERLPEDSDEYLVSVIDGSEEGNNYKAVGVAWFAHKKDYGIKESEWRELGIDETVIAWMPLPDPYEPQENEVSEVSE